jgi:hypothetical protein
MITGAQIRAGKALLNWSAATLARRSLVTAQNVREAERYDGLPKVNPGHLAALEAALIAGGVELIGTVGVKLADARQLSIPIDKLNASND